MNSQIGGLVEEGRSDAEWWPYMANGHIWPPQSHRSGKGCDVGRGYKIATYFIMVSIRKKLLSDNTISKTIDRILIPLKANPGKFISFFDETWLFSWLTLGRERGRSLNRQKMGETAGKPKSKIKHASGDLNGSKRLMQKIRDVSENTWEDLKQGAETIWDMYKNSFKKAKSEFQRGYREDL